MAIATTTAILIGAGLSAAGSAYAAKKQGDAADNATEAQTEAADKALAAEKEMFDLGRSDLAPYRNVGQFSMGQLGHLTGMPPDFGTQAVTDATDGVRRAIPRPQPIDQSQPIQRWPSAEQQPTSITNRAQMATPQAQALRDLGGTQQTASGYVRMRAPDGSTKDISPDQVGFYEARGASRIA